MVTCQKIFMLFFAHYRANQMLGQLYKKVELDIDKIVHKSKYLKQLTKDFLLLIVSIMMPNAS